MKVSATSRTTSMAAAGAAEQRAMGVVRDGGRVASLKRTKATAVDLRRGNSAGVEESECGQSNGKCTGTAGLLSDCRPRAGGERFPWAWQKLSTANLQRPSACA
jgi:hypothetical protein